MTTVNKLQGNWFYIVYIVLFLLHTWSLDKTLEFFQCYWQNILKKLSYIKEFIKKAWMYVKIGHLENNF